MPLDVCESFQGTLEMPGVVVEVAAAVNLERVSEMSNPQATMLHSALALTLPRPAPH